MTKTYKLLSSEAEDNQKTIVISEEVTDTKEERVTIAQLKEKHSQKLEQIENLKQEADSIVDQLIVINDNAELDLIVEDLPIKINK